MKILLELQSEVAYFAAAVLIALIVLGLVYLTYRYNGRLFIESDVQIGEKKSSFKLDASREDQSKIASADGKNLNNNEVKHV